MVSVGPHPTLEGWRTDWLVSITNINHHQNFDGDILGSRYFALHSIDPCLMGTPFSLLMGPTMPFSDLFLNSQSFLRLTNFMITSNIYKKAFIKFYFKHAYDTFSTKIDFMSNSLRTSDIEVYFEIKNYSVKFDNSESLFLFPYRTYINIIAIIISLFSNFLWYKWIVVMSITLFLIILLCITDNICSFIMYLFISFLLTATVFHRIKCSKIYLSCLNFVDWIFTLGLFNLTDYCQFTSYLSRKRGCYQESWIMGKNRSVNHPENKSQGSTKEFFSLNGKKSSSNTSSNKDPYRLVKVETTTSENSSSDSCDNSSLNIDNQTIISPICPISNSTPIEMETGSEAQNSADCEIPVYIFARGFPDTVMNEADQKVIVEKLSDMISDFLEIDSDCTQITKTLPLDGFIKVFVLNQATALWIAKTMEQFSNIIVSDTLPPRVKKYVKATLRIRKRSKTLTESELKKHLMLRNKGLNLDGCTLNDVQNLPSRDGNESIYKLLIFSLDETALAWLKEREGKVFFDVEMTKFIWADLKNQLQNAKKTKFENI